MGNTNNINHMNCLEYALFKNSNISDLEKIDEISMEIEMFISKTQPSKELNGTLTDEFNEDFKIGLTEILEKNGVIFKNFAIMLTNGNNEEIYNYYAFHVIIKTGKCCLHKYGYNQIEKYKGPTKLNANYEYLDTDFQDGGFLEIFKIVYSDIK